MSEHSTARRDDAATDSTCSDFDRARSLMQDHREDDALDSFEVAIESAADPLVQASAAAHVAGLLLGFGRPWEVAEFAAVVRERSGRSALGDLLEASACIQLGDGTGALELVGASGPVEVPYDPWYPCSDAGMHAVRIRALVLVGRFDDAWHELHMALSTLSDRPEIWETVAVLAAQRVVDPFECVEYLSAEHVVDVFGWISGAPADGLDAIAEALWQRNPGDVRVLAASTLCAWRLDAHRSLLWSLRLLDAGFSERIPVLEQAEMVQVAPADRVRAAAVGIDLDEDRARAALEAAVPLLGDDELAVALGLCLDTAPALADSFVVAAATTTLRCLVVATELLRRDFLSEAYAVTVAGLQLPTADTLDARAFDGAMPVDARYRLMDIAVRRGESDVAAVLDSVAA